MATYRKKIPHVQAFQWHSSTNVSDVVKCDAVGHYILSGDGRRSYISEGDYIINDGVGGHCRIDAALFEANYEEVSPYAKESEVCP